MNKRQKKKRALVSQVAFLLTENHLLRNSIAEQTRVQQSLNQRIEQLESLIGQNAQAINAVVAKLESENKQLRIDLNTAIAEFRKPKKKSFFSHK